MFLEAVGKRIFSFSHKNAQQNDIIRKNISYCVVRRSYNNRRRLLKLLPTMQQQVYCQLLFNWMTCEAYLNNFYPTYINYLKFYKTCLAQIYSKTIFKMRISTFSIKLSHFYLIPNQQTSGLIENNFSNSLRYWNYSQFQGNVLNLYFTLYCEILILYSRGNYHYLRL